MDSIKDIHVKQVLAIIGGIMFIVGFITGFLPVGGNCGSAFSGSDSYLDGAGSCELFRGEAIRSTWQLMIGGALLAIGTSIVSLNNSDRAETASRQIHGGPPRDMA